MLLCRCIIGKRGSGDILAMFPPLHTLHVMASLYMASFLSISMQFTVHALAHLQDKAWYFFCFYVKRYRLCKKRSGGNKNN